MERKDINLIIPRGWNECSSEQLEMLSELAVARNIAMQLGKDEQMSDHEFKFMAFLKLAGLKEECTTEWIEGDAVYWFTLKRSTWWKRTFCKKILVPIHPWEVKAWVDKHLKWLDEPYQRTKAPYEYVKVGRRRLKCLGTRMLDCTYRQYINLENILKQYWVVQQLLQKQAESEAKKHTSTHQNDGGQIANSDPLWMWKELTPRKVLKAVWNMLTLDPIKRMPDAMQQQMKNLDQLKRMFMATMLSPAVHITEETHGGSVVKCRKVTYQFDDAQVELYMDRFTKRQVECLFPVLLQFYMSTQRYFSTLYPDLYVERDDKDPQVFPDFIRTEIESMSTIMKYQGFSTYKDVYDSDAVHVLKVLDNMSRESKEYKKLKTK